MWIQIWVMRHYIRNNDLTRNGQIPEPDVATLGQDIRYAKGHGKWHLLDIFAPKNAKGPLPLAVIVHGGGWVYGDKGIYRLYAKDIARRGFAVISYNYILAPEKRFPSQLNDLDQVLCFAKAHAAEYGFDTNHVFLIGDSAGAQLSVQYSAIATNPEYRKLFTLQIPLQIKGLGLACGVYSPLGNMMEGEDLKAQKLLWQAYLGSHFDPKDPHYDPLAYLTKDFPPCYVFSAEKDMVQPQLPILTAKLKKIGIPFQSKIYTSKEGNKLQHVFHCTINEEHAIMANDDQCAYLKSLIK